MKFDLQKQESRAAFRQAIAVNNEALSFVADVATRIGVHCAYNYSLPRGVSVQRSTSDRPGTIIGIIGGRQFLVNDGDIAWLTWQWVRLDNSSFVPDVKAARSLALLILADEYYGAHDTDTAALQNDSSVDGAGIATIRIVRCLQLQEENERTQATLDACYETIHAARKELGLSLRESVRIPQSIRDLKRRIAR